MWVFRIDTQQIAKQPSFQTCVLIFSLINRLLLMGDRKGGGGDEGFLAVGNGSLYKLNDLVDVFVGTGANTLGWFATWPMSRISA